MYGYDLNFSINSIQFYKHVHTRLYFNTFIIYSIGLIIYLVRDNENHQTHMLCSYSRYCSKSNRDGATQFTLVRILISLNVTFYPKFRSSKVL